MKNATHSTVVTFPPTTPINNTFRMISIRGSSRPAAVCGHVLSTRGTGLGRTHKEVGSLGRGEADLAGAHHAPPGAAVGAAARTGTRGGEPGILRGVCARSSMRSALGLMASGTGPGAAPRSAVGG